MTTVSFFLFTLFQKQGIRQHSRGSSVRHKHRPTALSQAASERVGRGKVFAENAVIRVKRAKTPCHRQASTCSVHPEQSGDWSRVVPRGHVQHQASLPGYKGAEGAGQPAGREHTASQSLWICPLRAGLLDSSILARRITVEKDGTVVLYLEHVLV